MAYRAARDAARRNGCDDARRQNYRPDYDRGYSEGKDRGYRDNYDRAYQSAYQSSYNATFGPASQSAYQSSYNGYYQTHYEEARSAAYQSRYSDIYDASYSAAHDRKYNEVYAGFAAAAFQKGQVDEAADFAARPVRLLNANVVETIDNGLFEPGEKLRIRLSLRNFGGQLAGRDVRVQVEAIDANRVVISQGDATLVRNLNANSETNVRDALEFQFTESAVNRASNLRLKVTYQGRDAGSQTFTIVSKYLMAVTLAEDPVLKEGLEAPVRFYVVNQSPKSSVSGSVLKIQTDANKLEIKNASLVIPDLAPGQKTVIEFTGIARVSDNQVQIPMVLQALASDGRRVGATEISTSASVRNDYKIDVTSDISNLRNRGVVRVNYRIDNVGSLRLSKGLQLRARIVDTANASNFVTVGPSPQYLAPLENGQSASFMIPIMSKAANDGGTLELEVQEDGVPVVISRTPF